MKVELLAPAGDLKRLKIAIMYGADAVYIGYEKLSLRANATNFSFEDIKEAVIFAHNRGKKIYVTVNIVLHNEEIKIVDEAIKNLSEIGVDALIISDPAIFKYANKYNMEIHLSTQASMMNYKACEFYKKQGVKRIVLARECSREDIIDIIENTNIDIETFIHGAMCAGVSGRCVMSNVFTNRDANRGGCSQVCRWDFDLLDENKKIITKDKPFTFCSKDLSMLAYIKDMIDVGIKSFKIEGRMRSSYYLATVISIYRRAIDNCLNKKDEYYSKEDKKALDNCANRDSVAQFYNGVYDQSCSYYNGRMEVSNQDFLGIVLDYDEKTHLATVEERNYFKKGDIVEIFSPTKDIITTEITKIYDCDNNLIEVVRHPKQIVKIYVKDKLDAYDMIRVKRIDKDNKM